jgi:antitoxin (DNA-binding transcriptional repressor) of toxin-antitoxin stability system
MGYCDYMNRGAVVGVRELRTHLSAYLRRVMRGEIVTVGDRRRKPIARLVRLERGPDDGWLEQLAAREVVVAPTAPFVLPKSIRLKGKGKLAAEMVLEDRR